MAAPPLLVVRYPMRLWVRETASPPQPGSRLQTQIRPALGEGRDASRRPELPLPAGSATHPAAQASGAVRCGPLGAGVQTTGAREGRKERKVGRVGKHDPTKPVC